MRQAVEVSGYALSHADESFQSIEDIEVIVAKHLGLGRNFTDWHFCRVVRLVFFWLHQNTLCFPFMRFLQNFTRYCYICWVKFVYTSMVLVVETRLIS